MITQSQPLEDAEKAIALAESKYHIPKMVVSLTI